jgi:hypothetical protein
VIALSARVALPATALVSAVLTAAALGAGNAVRAESPPLETSAPVLRTLVCPHPSAPTVARTCSALAVRLATVNSDLNQLLALARATAVDTDRLVLFVAGKQMHETQMSFNLQYLQLQSQMQHENRSFTAISNIMKTKHDTVKNSISNIR